MSNAQSNAPSTQHITASQRAAVVIAVLGEEAAKPIVDRLDDQAIANIAASLETINYLAREQLIEIVMDFLGHLRSSSGSLRGGAETSRQLMESLLDESRLNVIYGNQEESPEEQLPEPENKEDFSRLWETFSKREPAHIAKYLSGLTPNIVGLILRNLDATLCSELICLLEEGQQSKVLSEMVNPPPPSYEIDAVVARMVRMEFLLAPEEDDDDGDAQLQGVGEILSLMPNDRRSSLMGHVSEKHAEKVDAIQKGMFELVDIPVMLNRNFVPVVFKELDQEFLLELMKVLESEYKEVSDYFLSNISNRMADGLRDDLSRMKAPNAEAAEQIQKDFLMKMMGMKRDGLIVLERPEEEEE
ncbi:MAG: FliG C-terminal domain-containing protein [Henriciella sp.]